MILLAIESSCDESAVAILKGHHDLLAHQLRSQIKAHQSYGGVVPELASRMHTEALPFLIQDACKDANIELNDCDAFAVTQGPGLEGALLVGVSAAKALSFTHQKPLIGVNHLQGHLYAHFLEKPLPFPLIFLLISGGHTVLSQVNDHFQFNLLGQTRDDAVGEAFDKVARLLDLGYPGGPNIEAKAREGKPQYRLPLPLNDGSLDFSFSGLKTAVIQFTHQNPTFNVADLCASFQKTVADILIKKAFAACHQHHIKTLAVGGGVSANGYLKDRFIEACPDDTQLHFVDRAYCTDNAAMIACAASYQLVQNTSFEPFSVKPGLKLCN